MSLGPGVSSLKSNNWCGSVEHSVDVETRCEYYFKGRALKPSERMYVYYVCGSIYTSSFFLNTLIKSKARPKFLQRAIRFSC